MQQTERIVAEICKSFIGNVPVVRKILLVMLAGGHVLLEDIPGVGKTTLALALSNALALKHNRVQFTPDVMPTDITGFSMPRGGQLVYQPGAALCNLLLADELNRAPSRTQAALLECMEEQQVTVDGATHPLPQPFMVIATQNPSGSAGTQLLPESQMDRFMMRLSIGYPALEGELEMLRRKHGEAGSEAVQPVASAADLIAMREAASRVYLADELYQYILSLTRATREHTDIRQGVSPRGSVAVMALAQAALMNGRDYTLPGDVKAVFVDATAHRLLLGPGVRSQTNAAQALLSGILDKVPAPTVRKRQ